MAHSNNPTVNEFWSAYSSRSVLKIKQISHDMSVDPSWLNAKSGNETLEFEIGQEVITTGQGVIKAGVRFIIKDAFKQNGFVRYLAGGVYHHQGDLTAFKELS